MENNDYLQAYYENYDEDGRLLTRHGQVEFTTTLHYVEKYLRPGMRVLEIGAGTGRYSHTLAQKGFRVDAVELLDHNIEIFRQNTQPGEPVTVTRGNATDLSAFGDNTYDLTLVLGPMYHLFTQEEKLQALSEAVRVTKPGGVVFAAYCMGDASIVAYGFVRGKIHEIIEKCMLNPETFETFSHPWDIFELYRTEDIKALREQFDVTPLHLLATDGYANHMRSTLAEMDKDTFALFLRYHLATCERPDMLGYSNHTLDIFKKN
ncbi:MAG: class I SAM-dependent methyltransferase [Clostridia bacterium]|nr:class I SAM-dependent methyltransferase [Clostridia bacterium]